MSAPRTGRFNTLLVTVAALGCALVGGMSHGPGAQAATTGTWSIVPSPDRPGGGNGLSDVACLNSGHCLAVGAFSSHGLLMRWDGSSWLLEGTPRPPRGVGYRFNGVGCVARHDCWVVGQQYDPRCGGCPTDGVLIEHWDGTSWSVVASQTPGALYDVTCLSASNCWAAGYQHSLDTGMDATLIEHWDGASWQVSPTPSATDPQRILQGVDCLSASECWAVGWIPPGSTQPIIERWDGTAWTEVASPGFTSTPRLLAVSCPMTADCWAVGDTGIGSRNPRQVLVEHWDGVSWSVSPAPDPSSTADTLMDVSCLSATNCQAVGMQSFGPMRTLAEAWDGTAWTVVGSANTDASTDNALLGVTCRGTACWSVGDGGSGTLIETLSP